MGQSLQSFERAQLREFLQTRFTLDELEAMAFDLGVDYELFTYKNKQKLSLELITYFEHRDDLACLVTEIVRLRPHNNLAPILAKLLPCEPQTKIQIIASTSQDITEDILEFLEALAEKHNLKREDITLIAAARSSIRLLVNVPHQIAEALLKSQEGGKIDDLLGMIEITAFTGLNTTTQELWQFIATDWSPIQAKDSLFPGISWQKAGEIFTLKNKYEKSAQLISGSGSHNFKIPLTSIKGYLDIIKSEAVGSLNEQQRNFLSVIWRNLEEITRRTDIYIQYLSEYRNLTNVQSLVLEIVKEVEKLSEEIPVALELFFTESLTNINPDILAYSPLIGQAIKEIIMNAVKHSSPHSSVLINVDLLKGDVVISVQDDGPGISEEKISQVFDPYFKTYETKIDELGGHGLGLYIAKIAAELYGGRVWVRSEEGKGSTFFMAIPIAFSGQDDTL